jgi:ABC-type glutathione transport system ATPase component
VKAPLLELRSVVRTYPSRRGRPRTTAVDQVDLDVAHRGSVAVVGPSGAGKSTLARLALGLETPDDGRVLFDGRDLVRRTGARPDPLGRRLQAVFQDPFDTLDPRLPVWWNITEALRIQGLAPVSGLRARADELLQSVGLRPSVAVRHPTTLSGGERQRVAIARAMSTRPDLLVLDEPVSAVDAAVTVELLDLIDRLRRTVGTALLVVTHELTTARRLCERIAVLDAGKLVETGSTTEVLDHPGGPVTRALVDAERAARRRMLDATDV